MRHRQRCRVRQGLFFLFLFFCLGGGGGGGGGFFSFFCVLLKLLELHAAADRRLARFWSLRGICVVIDRHRRRGVDNSIAASIATSSPGKTRS